MVTQLSNSIVSLLPKLPLMFLGFLAGYILIRVVLFFLKKALKVVKTPKSLIDIFISLSSVVLWIIFLAEFSRHIGLSGIAATFSGVLIAIGLALANGASLLTSDIISGLFLAKETDFEVGYKIKYGDIEGRVKKLDLRKVRVETKEGQIHVIPNSKFDSTGWAILDRGPK